MQNNTTTKPLNQNNYGETNFKKKLMKITETKIKDCLIIEDRVFSDDRGQFYEVFNEKTFLDKTGIRFDVVQENESFSYSNVLRGLHFQRGEFAQGKIVRVLKGHVYDVCVDLRPDSKSFGKYVGIELNGSDRLQFHVPRGCAHGFLVLSEYAIFNYKVDNFYNKESEGGLIFDDPDVGINWGVDRKNLIISEKDLTLPKLKDLIL
jgi:dTDP-4-dehydrorhamnose 3,5-epimerase